MKIKAFIVDDEPLARERLRQLLATQPDVQVVGESDNGRDAVDAITRTSPDVVFLDIQMPERDGFQVLGELEPQQRPWIVFVTAFDQFAIKAFEVHAIDYLLKPFDRDRFLAAMDGVRQRMQSAPGAGIEQRMTALLEELGTSKPHTLGSDRLAIKTNGRVRLFRIDQIDWIEAADNYVSVHIGQESILHRETLTSMETRLPNDRFVRISRSTVVNLERVKEIQPLFHGDHVLILQDSTKLTLTRNYRARIEHLLS